jgi:hypothetical protein
MTCGDTASIQATRHGVSSANIRCMSTQIWRQFPNMTALA